MEWEFIVGIIIFIFLSLWILEDKPRKPIYGHNLLTGKLERMNERVGGGAHTPEHGKPYIKE